MVFPDSLSATMKRTADDTVNSREKKNATINDCDSYRDVWKLENKKNVLKF